MPRCCYLNCREPGVWVDEDDLSVYCGAHLIYVHAVDVLDESAQKRIDFADEYSRDAEREAARS